MGKDAQIQIRAHGKINLGIDVIGKREDGYHEVKMIMQTVRLHDRVTLKREEVPGIRITSNLSFLPCDQTNLAYKAAELLFREFSLEGGLSVHLDKRIPVAAGMAGGSADCAAVLQGVNRLYRLGLNLEQLQERGLRLGADVPYCLMGGTALAEGIGERLTALPPAPGRLLLIAKPPVSLSSRYIYTHLTLDEKTVHPDIDGMVEAIRRGDAEGVICRLGNVLEDAALGKCPQIGQIKRTMLENGARGALMSGSGPTVFGFFDDIRQARRAAKACRSQKLARQIYITELYPSRKSAADKAPSGQAT